MSKAASGDDSQRGFMLLRFLSPFLCVSAASAVRPLRLYVVGGLKPACWASIQLL